MKGVRGESKSPGELRHSQNWIGLAGCTLKNASFIPPSTPKMAEVLYDLKNYMNDDSPIDPLIKIALIHYQFETIHPFLDGNGRIGRLIIPLWLMNRNYLSNPLLYFSLYFKSNRQEYYGLLMDVRFKGKYEEWINFFLKGIIEMSSNSIITIQRLKALMEEVNQIIINVKYKNKEVLQRLMDYIYRHPYFDSSDVANEFIFSKPTVSNLINILLESGIIRAVNDKKRYVIYVFKKYVDILEEGTEI